MKRIQYHQYGGPEVMRLETFELPDPVGNQLAIKVHFATVNPIDWKIRRGEVKIVTGKSFPRPMGMDFSGTVIAVGPEVTRFQVGDPVFGLSRFKESGALAEAVITEDGYVSRKPDSLSFEEAACLGTPGITAWALIDRAKLQPGQHVFINGCGGTVGEAAVQIARMLNARISGSCSAGDMEKARSFGVQEAFDYRTIDFRQMAGRFDVVFDAATVLSPAIGIRMLRKGGVFLDLDPNPGKFLRAIFDRRLKPVIGNPRADMLDGIARAAGNGDIKVRIAKSVDLDDAIALVTALEKGERFGGRAVVAMPTSG